MCDGTKVPYKGSRGFKDATDNEQEIRHWWTQTPNANIGIATGSRSFCFVLDVDTRDGGDASLLALEAKHGPLPETVIAMTGGGGRHCFFRHPGGRVKNSVSGIGSGLDVRGDGGYVVGASSIHETGALYEWTEGRSPFEPDNMLLAKAPQWLLDAVVVAPEDDLPPEVIVEVIRAVPHTVDEAIKMTTAMSGTGKLSIEDAIRMTIPDGHGQRHRKVFEFARALKAMPEYAGESVATLRPLVERWWGVAKPFIQTQDFTETWSDFVAAWPRVTTPLGAGPINHALNAAKLAPLPKCAEQYDSEPARLLIKLCRELQSRAGDAPFYLGCRTAGQTIGVGRVTANRYLSMLIADDILDLVEKGTTNRASRYRYLRENDCGTEKTEKTEIASVFSVLSVPSANHN